MNSVSHIVKLGGFTPLGECELCRGNKPLVKHKKMYVCRSCKERELDKDTSKLESKKYAKAKTIWSNWGLR